MKILIRIIGGITRIIWSRVGGDKAVAHGMHRATRGVASSGGGRRGGKQGKGSGPSSSVTLELLAVPDVVGLEEISVGEDRAGVEAMGACTDKTGLRVGLRVGMQTMDGGTV